MSSYIPKGTEEINIVKKQLYAYYIYRKRLDILRVMQIKTQADTIYILETDPNELKYDKESTIFTRKKILSYRNLFNTKGNYNTYKTDSLIITNKPLYSRHMLKLVVQWGLEKLKKEGEKYGMIPQDFVWLTRIIFEDKKYKIDCIRFKYFLNFERDYFDDYN